MNQATGVVERISEKDGMYGKMYSAKIDGSWYGVGKFPPKFKEGQSLEFTWTAKGNFRNLEPKSVKVLDSAAPAAAPAAAAPQRSYGMSDDRQDTISKQAAFNTAIAMLDVLRQAEAVPGIKKTATADDKYDVYRSLVNKMATEFYGYNTGKKWELGDISQSVPDEGAPADQDWD